MASKTTAQKARARALLVNIGNRPVDLPSTEPPPPPPPPPVDMLIGAFSPPVGQEDERVQLWQPSEDYFKLANPLALPFAPHSVRYEPSLDRVFISYSTTAQLETDIYKRSGEGLELERTFTFMTSYTNATAVSPDGQWIASVGSGTGGAVRTWRVLGGGEFELVPTTGATNGAGVSIAWRPDSLAFVVTGTNILWHYTYNQESGRFDQKSALALPSSRSITYIRGGAYVAVFPFSTGTDRLLVLKVNADGTLTQTANGGGASRRSYDAIELFPDSHPGRIFAGALTTGMDVRLDYYDIGPTGLITAGPVAIAGSSLNSRFALTPTHLVTAEGSTFPVLYDLDPVNGTVVRSANQPAVQAIGRLVTGATYAPNEAPQ